MALHYDHLDHRCLDLLDREGAHNTKVLSSAVKQQRKDKATWYVQEQGVEADGDQGDVCGRGLHTQAGEDGAVCAANGAAVQEADMKATFQLSIIGMKKPQLWMYTQLGVMTKGTIIEVNVSELGMVTTVAKWCLGSTRTNNPVHQRHLYLCTNGILTG
ncbi:hypothetical protein BU17DRAFT_62444 [Hysterangium stoloniferum]|nr:hypothetical protein BU17DRAFT_62444 [Hysterangium stoloniferum]